VREPDNRRDPSGARSVNGKIGLRVPAKVVEGKCKLYKKAGKSHHRTEMINDSDFSIINQN